MLNIRKTLIRLGLMSSTKTRPPKSINSTLRGIKLIEPAALSEAQKRGVKVDRYPSVCVGNESAYLYMKSRTFLSLVDRLEASKDGRIAVPEGIDLTAQKMLWLKAFMNLDELPYRQTAIENLKINASGGVSFIDEKGRSIVSVNGSNVKKVRNILSDGQATDSPSVVSTRLPALETV